MSTCDTCGKPIEFRSPEDFGWCQEHCKGITDRIEARQQEHYQNEKRDPCNLCGLSIRLAPAPWDQPLGLVQTEVVGGYPSTPGNGSGALDDCTGYRFSLCEFCLDWLFVQFVIPVETLDPMRALTLRPDETIEEAMKRTGGFVSLGQRPPPDPWRSAEERVRTEAWREMKERFLNEKQRRDACRKQGPVCTYCKGEGSDPVVGRCPYCNPYCDKCRKRWSTKDSADCPVCSKAEAAM